MKINHGEAFEYCNQLADRINILADAVLLLNEQLQKLKKEIEENNANTHA